MLMKRKLHRNLTLGRMMQTLPGMKYFPAELLEEPLLRSLGYRVKPWQERLRAKEFLTRQKKTAESTRQITINGTNKRTTDDKKPSQIDEENPYNLGLDYRTIGDNEKAAECFRKYIQDNPDDYGAHHLLADSYFLSGRYEDAIIHYNKAIKLTGDQDDCKTCSYYIGLSYGNLGKYEEALKSFKRSLSWFDDIIISPISACSVTEKIIRIGDCYSKLGKRKRAIRRYKQALRICKIGIKNPPRFVDGNIVESDFEALKRLHTDILEKISEISAAPTDSLKESWKKMALVATLVAAYCGVMYFAPIYIWIDKSRSITQRSKKQTMINCKASMDCYSRLKLERPESLLAPDRVILYGTASFGIPHYNGKEAADVLKSLGVDFEFKPFFDNNSNYGFTTPYKRELLAALKFKRNDDKFILGTGVHMIVDGNIYLHPDKNEIEEAIKLWKKKNSFLGCQLKTF
jgi:tetratricopeptide (TPR) repeat protein